MPSPPAFIQGAVDSIKEKGARYVGVSVVNIFVGQGLILFFHAILHMNQTVSNALAVCVSAVPAYYLSRIWVWGKTGKSHFKKEVLPFWIFILIGLVFSTALVAIAAHLTGTAGEATANMTTIQKLLPNLVNMLAFGILWVIRFFLMEKLFTQHPEMIEELIGGDFIEAFEGTEAVEAAERAAAERSASAGHSAPDT